MTCDPENLEPIPSVTYLLSRDLDLTEDEPWDSLCEVHLTFSKTDDLGHHATFMPECGCEECQPHPRTIEELRQTVENKLRDLDLEFTFLEAEMFTGE